MMLYWVGFLCSAILSGIAIVLLNRFFKEPPLHHFRKKLSLLLIVHIFSDLSWVLFILLDEAVLPRIFFYRTIFRIIWSIALTEYSLILLPFYEFVCTQKYIKEITFFLMIIASLFQIIVGNSDLIGLQFLNPYFFAVEQPLLLFCLISFMLFYYFSVQHSVVLLYQSQTVIYCFSGFLFLGFAQLLSKYHIYPFSLISRITFALLSSYALIFAVLITAWKLKQLRFLNYTNKVEAGERIQSQAVLRCALERTEKIQTKNEFLELTKRFFTDGFAIDESRISLCLSPQPVLLHTRQIAKEQKELLAFAQSEGGIFSHDELMISAGDTAAAPIVKKTLEVLERMDALFLIPIIHKEVLVGEIIVNRKVGERRLFSREAQSSMMIFASAIGIGLKLLAVNQLCSESMHAAESARKESDAARRMQLCTSKQLLHYSKLLQTVLTPSVTSFALIEYERGGARSMNRDAITLFGKYPTANSCPVTKVMKKTAENSIAYQHSIITYATQKNGVLFEIEAIPQRKKIAVLTVRHVAMHHETARALIHEFMRTEYETLKENLPLISLIEQLIMENSPEFLFLKASLLYTLLHEKPVVLQGAEDNLEFFIAQLTRLFFPEKQIFRVDGAQQHASKNEYASLFGVANSFKKDVTQQQSLIEQAEKAGILWLKNVDTFAHEIQEAIAQLCVFNTYTPLYGDQPKKNSASLLVTFHDDPLRAYATGKLHPALFSGLSKLAIVVPDSYSRSSVKQDSAINQFTAEGALARFDPFLAHVQKCGAKQVLREKELLSALWDRYEDYGKIAAILNIHRTTVYRACARFHIGKKKTAISAL